MEDLTFGEQVKIILGRKGMTIKELAETIEARTGKKMSRQNLTQRLGRDNFQEQDMRMIAAILECPFQLSIMGGETAKEPVRTAHHEKTAEAAAEQPEKTEAAETETALGAEQAGEVFTEVPQTASESVQEAPSETPEETKDTSATGSVPKQEPEIITGTAEEDTEAAETTESGSDEQALEASSRDDQDERDMTIGELYEIHEELSELEENVKAGESVEAIREELEKPRKERFGNFFLRRKHSEPEKKAEKESNASHEVRLPDSGEMSPSVKMQDTKKTDFEPVISYDDAEEDREQGEVNPYTGREYQSNSVRMHPTRIGYVQVYDRSIHKWTDMTEWAFLGYQERKKALLGKAYEPPIYLD